jgi:hypothetical protein
VYCRACGHDNERDTGRCDNCGFDLSFQTLPLDEQRKGLQKALPPEGKEQPPPHLDPGHKSPAGIIGAFIVVIGLAVVLLMVNTMERPERELENGESDYFGVIDTIQAPQDTMPGVIGSDIVYVFDPSGQSATPRTNINLSLIPDGTTVSFLAQRALSIKPVVNFLIQKMGSRDFNILSVDRLCVWTDSTHAAFDEVPLVKPWIAPPGDSAAMGPVELRLLFTDEWIRATVDEFNMDRIEPTTGLVYNASGFRTVIDAVAANLARRDLDGREVHVTALFPDNSDMGQVMDILVAIAPTIDSLGYKGFLIKYAIIEE